MGEVVKFPGTFLNKYVNKQPVVGSVSFIEDRKLRRIFPGLGNSNNEIAVMMGMVLDELTNEPELGVVSKKRRRRYMRGFMEEEWWDARVSGDLGEQKRIEKSIVDMFRVHRGRNIIDRLRTVARNHEM